MLAEFTHTWPAAPAGGFAAADGWFDAESLVAGVGGTLAAPDAVGEGVVVVNASTPPWPLQAPLRFVPLKFVPSLHVAVTGADAELWALGAAETP